MSDDVTPKRHSWARPGAIGWIGVRPVDPPARLEVRPPGNMQPASLEAIARAFNMAPDELAPLIGASPPAETQILRTRPSEAELDLSLIRAGLRLGVPLEEIARTVHKSVSHVEAVYFREVRKSEDRCAYGALGSRDGTTVAERIHAALVEIDSARRDRFHRGPRE